MFVCKGVLSNNHESGKRSVRRKKRLSAQGHAPLPCFVGWKASFVDVCCLPAPPTGHQLKPVRALPNPPFRRPVGRCWCIVYANGSKTVRAFLLFLLLGCFVHCPYIYIYMYASMLHLDVAFHTRLTLHTGLDATLCYAADVARGGGGWGGGGHVDVPVTLHTGLDATLCYAGDVARGGGGLGWGGHVDVPVTLHTGLDATLCYAGDVARGGGGLGWGGAC